MVMLEMNDPCVTSENKFFHAMSWWIPRKPNFLCNFLEVPGKFDFWATFQKFMQKSGL
jgi:hypothetical protein